MVQIPCENGTSHSGLVAAPSSHQSSLGPQLAYLLLHKWQNLTALYMVVNRPATPHAAMLGEHSMPLSRHRRFDKNSEQVSTP